MYLQSMLYSVQRMRVRKKLKTLWKGQKVCWSNAEVTAAIKHVKAHITKGKLATLTEWHITKGKLATLTEWQKCKTTEDPFRGVSISTSLSFSAQENTCFSKL